MAKITVLVVADIGKEGLRRIADAGPEIEVIDGSHLWVAPDPFIPDRKEDSRGLEFSALLAKAEVIYGLRFPSGLIFRAPRLRWIQHMGTGVNAILTDDIVNSRVIITNISSVRSVPVAEWAFGLVVMLAKKASVIVKNQENRQWQRFSPVLLHSKTLGIVGLGHIGMGVARLAHAFRMRTIAIRRSAPGVTQPRYVDRMMERESLPDLLAESDFVVLAVPATQETYGLIGERELKAMKPTSYLINVGRGSAVDDNALIRALREKWISGAALDTYTAEPLSPESELWELPNMIISPHVGGEMENAAEKTTEFFCENLRRYVSGKKLRDMVDKSKGY
jgi:D-2-hydroxyacid dehydrogenase (NADP+)